MPALSMPISRSECRQQAVQVGASAMVAAILVALTVIQITTLTA